MTAKLAGLLIKGIDEKELKKIILNLVKEIILFSIKDKILSEFLKLGLQNKFKDEIEAWLIYLDQQEFGKKLEKQMIEEIERFMAEKKTIEEMVKETFKKPEWEREFINAIPANYVFKSILGLA